MSKNTLASIAKAGWATVRKHSPEILMGLGIGGMVTAIGLAITATPKAVILIEEEKARLQEELQTDEEVALKPVETVKVTWKCYIPTVTVAILSTCCLIGSSSVNFRRNAALATAYAISETALKEYQEKVIEEIGEKKERTIRDAVAKDRLDRNPVTSREVVVTDKGNVRCFDVLSGRYFTSDINELKKIANDLNRQMRDENYISLNEFYYALGLSGIKLGDELGWNIDKGYIDLDFSSHLDNEGKPCLVVDYSIAPRYDYQ